jgi:ubiquinone/menaquinone biosynthesis C-methylase UbiE
MGKKTCFPRVLSVRLSQTDAGWLSRRAQSLRLTDSSFARILIGIGIESVQKKPSLVLSGGADSD